MNTLKISYIKHKIDIKHKDLDDDNDEDNCKEIESKDLYDYRDIYQERESKDLDDNGYIYKEIESNDLFDYVYCIWLCRKRIKRPGS